jgi:F0F1-type ATP synthase assembly protein I
VLPYFIKLVLTASLVVFVSEVSKRSTLVGGLLASLPLVSFLGMIWLYHDTRDAGKVAELAESILWLVLPSLVFFMIFPVLIRKGISFYPGLLLSTGLMIGAYYLTLVLLKSWKP